MALENTSQSKPVNLIADKLAYREEIKKQVLRAFVLLMAYAVVGSVLFHVIGVAAAKTSIHMVSVQDQVKILEQQNSLDEKVKSHMNQNLAISQWVIRIRNEIRSSRRVFLMLADKMPSGTFFDSVTLTNDPSSRVLEVSGTALSLEDVATLLSESGALGTVMLESTETRELNGISVVEFKFSIELGSPRA